MLRVPSKMAAGIRDEKRQQVTAFEYGFSPSAGFVECIYDFYVFAMLKGERE